MPKAKSSKANTPSWRTLMRQAKTVEKEGNLVKGAKLRARAGELRKAAGRRAAKKPATTKPRSEFVSKAWVTRRAKAKEAAIQAGGLTGLIAGGQDNAAQGINRASNLALSFQEPGHSEIVGGATDRLVEELCTMARSKGGKDQMAAKLLSIRANAKFEGQAEADHRATKRLIEVQEKMSERVVCGFIAEVDVSQQQYRGLPPDMIWNLSSFTVTKIVDALNKSGYTAKGKRD